MEDLWVTVVIAVGSLMILLANLTKARSPKSTKWPQGPWKLPIIGNLHQLSWGGELVHVTLAKMAKEHGKIMTVWFGCQPSIVVSDHELAWEVLVTKASYFSSRALPPMSKLTSADWRTIATSNFGPYWQSLRKCLQNTSLSPTTIAAQAKIQEQDIARMIQILREEASSNDGVVKPLVHLRRATVRLIARLCFGFEFEDESFVAAMDGAIEDTIKLSGHARLVDAFEFTKYIPGLGLPFQESSKVNKKIEELLLPHISRHTSLASASCSCSCYMHSLLSQNLPEEVIIFNLFELFMLAVDSTSTAVLWSLAFLIRDPKIQQKLYSEVSKPRNEMITVEEVGKFQYLNAVVKETMRMKPIAPLAVPHRAARDCDLMGTKVAKGTAVVVNVYAVLHDPSVWLEPQRFLPERFLVSSGCESEAGTGAVERSFLAFGAGRRICAGMELAKLHVGVTLANLVNFFDWSSAVDGQLPDVSEDLTFILRMKYPVAARIGPRRI